MLRSKVHRPWQPRVSGSPVFNPSAHTTESDSSFSDDIEELEREVHAPAKGEDPAAAASSRHAAENVDSPSAAPEISRSKSRWYASLVERFTKH